MIYGYNGGDSHTVGSGRLCEGPRGPTLGDVNRVQEVVNLFLLLGWIEHSNNSANLDYFTHTHRKC